MEYGNNLDPDIEKLIKLLKKILKKHPKSLEQIAKMADPKAINVNVCFLTFVPMTPDDLEELNEVYEEYVSRTEEHGVWGEDSNLEFRLTQEDLDFLKQNGLHF